MLGIKICKNRNVTLTKQVYQQICDLILHGSLVAGQRVPSTRELASSLGISRIVILEAYEQLAAEGFIESRQGSGTRVAAGACLGNELKKRDNQENKTDQAVLKLPFDFRSGIPALDRFPRAAWGRIYRQISLETKDEYLAYDIPEGREELRKEIADYLLTIRGIHCSLNRIVITTGATQGLTLIARLLYRPDSVVIVEDPTNNRLGKLLEYEGFKLEAVPVDRNGMKTNLINQGTAARLIYVTPSHQFPMGGILPVQRRIDLLSYTKEKDSYIIEDDYDSEYRYEGSPLSPMWALNSERVFYLGSFSKTLAPALRLGYLILPERWLHRYRETKRYADVHTPSLQQLALAQFIREGMLDKHIVRMRKLYKQRRTTLLEALRNEFGDQCVTQGSATGLHLVAEFNGVDITPNLINKAKQEGVGIYPVEKHTINKGNYKNHLIMGYGHLAPEIIVEGIRRLKAIFGV